MASKCTRLPIHTHMYLVVFNLFMNFVFDFSRDFSKHFSSVVCPFNQTVSGCNQKERRKLRDKTCKNAASTNDARQDTL